MWSVFRQGGISTLRGLSVAAVLVAAYLLLVADDYEPTVEQTTPELTTPIAPPPKLADAENIDSDQTTAAARPRPRNTGQTQNSEAVTTSADVSEAAPINGDAQIGENTRRQVTGGVPAEPDATQRTTDLDSDTAASGADAPLESSNDAQLNTRVTGERLLASLETGTDADVDTTSAPLPDVTQELVPLSPSDAPRFDLVRIDKYNAAVVAGKTGPGLHVNIVIDGTVITDVVADSSGNFVALFDLPAAEGPQVMSLVARGPASQTIGSPDSVMVFGREVVQSQVNPTDEMPTPPVDVAPAIVKTSELGVALVQPPSAPPGAEPDAMSNVTIDLISYDSSGEVVLSGRSQPDRLIRVYVDGAAIKTGAVSQSGVWKLELPEVDAGLYSLRIDELNELGRVTSRVETPFKKENPDTVRRNVDVAALPSGQSPSALPRIQKITIQPGSTLWALAEANYGEGALYIQIFEANKEYIKDPDLIYPGQIFSIPKQ